LQSDDVSQIKGFLNKIGISGHLLLNLVNDTLTLSRLDNGKLELAPAPVALTVLIEDIAVPMQMTAARNKLVFTIDTKNCEACTVLADSLNVQKIVLNLLGNSMKFTPAGKGVQFLVSTEPAKETVQVTFTIRDEGMGMSPEFLEHLFEPFVQGQKTGLDGTPGTGLGLAIVKHLVDLMGGTIAVTSEVGKGTAFVVRLRFARSMGVPSAIPAKEGNNEFEDGLFSCRHILVCEDNELNMEIAKYLLENKDMVVTEAVNGLEGLEAFKKSPVAYYDAVLMDLRMPIMDGMQALAEIRALDRSDACTVPIIVMTADAFPEDVKRCLDAGFTDHVAKPVDPPRLYAALAEGIKHA
jgi:CheY-like chemotaxis protein